MNLTIPTSAVSILFVLVLALLVIVLRRMQMAKDTFDLKDIICEWTGEKQIVSTSKSLLAGAFLVSSYYIIKSPSEVNYAAYLAAWVVNGGIAAWRKVKESEVAA